MLLWGAVAKGPGLGDTADAAAVLLGPALGVWMLRGRGLYGCREQNGDLKNPAALWPLRVQCP